MSQKLRQAIQKLNFKIQMQQANPMPVANGGAKKKGKELVKKV